MLVNGAGDEDRCEERKDISLKDGDKEFQETDADLAQQTADRNNTPECHVALGGTGDKGEDDAQRRVPTHDIAKQSHRKDEMFNDKAEAFNHEHEAANAYRTRARHTRVGNEVSEEATKAKRLHSVGCGRNKGT